jgi:hypothetical protein
MKIVSAFFPTAVAIENRPRQNMAGNIDSFLPQISDMGAQHRGPKAKPTLLSTEISRCSCP